MNNSLRDLQLCEFEILKEVKRICEENRITYYLSSGTLLGAVRHNGFIPWDDDIDIEMPYQDYKRFVKIAQRELGNDYFLQNKDTDRTFSSLFSKVRKNNTTMLSTYELGRPGHHGVWIDVFPILSIGGSFDLHFRKLCIRICNFSLMDKERFYLDQKWIRSQTSAVRFYCVKAMLHLPYCIRKSIHSLFSALAMWGGSRKTKQKGVLWTEISPIQPTEIYEGKDTTLTFEKEYFSVPPKYSQYLKNTYGNYMQPPPENQRNGGHGKLIIDLENSWEQYNIAPK